MSSSAHKLCLVGEPGAGKTSLVRRLRTLLSKDEPPRAAPCGITVARLKLSPEKGESIDVTLWDVAGRSAVDTLNQAFLSGVDGVMAVADGSVAASVAVARQLLLRVRELYPNAPTLLVLNKSDLPRAAVDGGSSAELPSQVVSALSGEGVEAAFVSLARRVASRELVRAP